MEKSRHINLKVLTDVQNIWDVQYVLKKVQAVQYYTGHVYLVPYSIRKVVGASLTLLEGVGSSVLYEFL